MKSRIALATLVLAAVFLLSRVHIPTLIAGNESTETSSAPVEPLPSPAAPGSAEPHLDVGPDGSLHMSWLEPLGPGEGHALKVASLGNGSWSRPQTVRSGRDFFVNWADFPSVLSLGDDRLVAHWLQRTGTATYAYGVRLAFSIDKGRTWSAPVTPHTDSSNTEHGFVSLWRTARGDGVEAVWLDGRKYDRAGHSPTNEMSLATAAFTPDGRPSLPERILDARVCDCCQTSAALTSRGPVIVYRDRSADEIRDISVVRREASGRWTAPSVVHADGWRINACPVNGPSIAARGDNVAVAWFTAANDTPTVRVAFSGDAGATFSRPIRVDEGRPAGRVDVDLTRDGAALVTWIERTGGDTAVVRLRRVERGGRSGAPATIATSSAARASGFPRMVVAGNDAIFAWTVPGRPSEVRVAKMKVQ
jgi:hypothetical protein